MANNYDDYFNFLFNQENNEPPSQDAAGQLEWVVDSGAAGNCTYAGDILYDIKRISSRAVVCADGGTSSTTIEGTVNMHGLSATKVLYLPAIDSNLLSVGCLTRDDHVVVFDKKGCEIYNESDVTVQGTVKARGRLAEDGLYKLIANENNRNVGSYNRNLWHRRLGHLDITSILVLQNYMSTGITMEEDDRNIECLVPTCYNYFEYQNCQMPTSNFNFGNYPKTTRPLELVYFYFSTSTYNVSLNGNRHYIVFIDDYTRKTFVYFFRTEFEIIPKLKMFQKYVEMYTGNKIKHMWTDIDLNYKKYYPFIDSFVTFNDINLTYSRNYTSIILWLIFYISTKTLLLLRETNMPNEFWAEITNAIVNLLNVSPNSGHPYCTPQEAWSGWRPDLSVIRVFGCKAYLTCLKKYVIHLGYDFDKREYRFMDVSHFGIYFRKTAIFFEDVQFYKSSSKDVE